MFKRLCPLFFVMVLVLSLTVPMVSAAEGDNKTICTVGGSSTGYVGYDTPVYIYVGYEPLTLNFLKDNPNYSIRLNNGTYELRTESGSKVLRNGGDICYSACADFASTCDPWNLSEPLYVVSTYNGLYDWSATGVGYLTVPVPDTLPSGVSGGDYALYFSGGYYYCLINFKPVESYVSYTGAEYRVNYTVEEPADLYAYSNGSWVLQSQNLTGSHLFGVSGSSDIIYYPDTLTFEGEDFFVPPLTLEKATEKGLQELLQTMGAALLILVGLGVCLMALWIGCGLFGKVFYRFLN